MMTNPDGPEIICAGAGIFLGAVTFFRGMQSLRATQKIARPFRNVSAPFAHHTSLPVTLLTGASMALACTGYLLWRLGSLSR